jgi:truncated hemoglobin YjbI
MLQNHETPLYDRIGGQAGLQRIIDRLFDRLCKDEGVGVIVDLESDDLLQFIMSSLGHNTYSSLDDYSPNLKMGEEEYNRFCQHLQDVMDETGVRHNEQLEVLSKLLNQKAKVVLEYQFDDEREFEEGDGKPVSERD